MNNMFKQRAEEIVPKMYDKKVFPERFVNFFCSPSDAFGVGVKEALTQEEFLPGESAIIDFGEHCVGTVSFTISHVDNYIDAPVKLRLRFGEIPMELYRDYSEYNGGISGSWLQEEIFIVDFPGNITLPRRYCFRYLEVTVLQTPQKVRLNDFCVNHTTSADLSNIEELKICDDELLAIDRIAAKTLEDCMQSVYEDGPKRDRRLWSGDFRLQALCDYYVFKNYDLIKRCLYLFAACYNEGKYLPSCLYHHPELFSKKTSGFMDYAFLYTVALCEYFEHTKDYDTAKELFPIAKSQLELAISGIDDNGVITIPKDSNGFIDWVPELKKLTPTAGVFLYALEKNIALAKAIGENNVAEKFSIVLENARKCAYKTLFDNEKKAFINDYDNNQYSVHSQVWMILGGVVEAEEGVSIIKKALADKGSLKPVSPYMHHYVVEALFKLGLKEEATEYIKNYWGGMLKLGADTFWEVYVPGDLSVSPYGDAIVNSFCHAWSCTPSYFIRKYLN